MNTLKKQSAASPSTPTLPQIPYGECHCGCGGKTKLAPYSDRSRGWIKGQPKDFIQFHFFRQRRPPSNNIVVEGVSCFTIPLTQNKEAIILALDFDRVSPRLWFAAKYQDDLYYAYTNIRKPDGSLKRVSMHHFLCPLEKGKVVDHRNGNTLDNRRSNLLNVTRTESNRNRRAHKGTSKFKGVCLYYKAWKATIYMDKRPINLGTFRNEKDAAKAYDGAARKYFGKFARLNFPREGESSAIRLGRDLR
jgi:hypothetical protein